MNPARQEQLAAFIQTQLGRAPRSLRVWCGLGLLLCGVGVGILTSVWFSGATGSEDVPVLIAVFGAFTAGFGGVFGWAWWRIATMASHPLVTALRENPRDVARVIPTTVRSNAGSLPGLTFELASGRSHIVLMNEETRAEFMVWLSSVGAQVG